MMCYILCAVAGFLACLVLMVLLRWGAAALHPGKRSVPTTKQRAKEFTQLMVLSDNAILWYMCVAYTALAAYSIYKNYVGSLPWLTGGLGLAFAAWATIQSFLIKKSEKQNTVGGITYDTAMQRLGADENKETIATEYTVDENNRDC